MQLSKNHLLALSLFLVLLNLLVKGWFLSYNAIAGDEPFSIYHAQMDVASIIRLLAQGNNPPLFEIILHYWIKIFGISEWSARMPSLIFSCVTVWILFNIGKKYFTVNIAITACCIFIFSNFHTLLAHEARAYTLFGMLTAMSMYYFMTIILKSAEKKIVFIAYILINILLIYTHYFGLIVIALQGLFVLLNAQLRDRYWKKLIIAIVILFAAYIPNMVVFVRRFFDSATNGTWLKPPNGLDSLYGMLRVFANMPVTTALVIGIFIISIVLFFLKKPRTKMPLANQLIVCWFVIPFFGMFLVSYWIPVFLDRYLMFVAIAFVLLLSITTNSIFQKNQYKIVLSGFVILLFVLSSTANPTNKRNVRETIAKVEYLKTDSSLIIIAPQHFVLNFLYYHDKNIFSNYHTTNIYQNILADLAKQNIYASNSIDSIPYQDFKHIVYLDAAADFSFPDNGINKGLSQSFTKKDKFAFFEIFTVTSYYNSTQ